MAAAIVGREKETLLLEKLLAASDEPQLIAIYGRRRIGKTHLIREFFRNKGVYLQFTGVQGAAVGEQLANLHEEVCSVFDQWTGRSSPKDWQEAFQRLIQSVRPLSKQQRVILFFDEVPWLATDAGFLRALEYNWNQHLSTLPGVVVALCGSASSWMIDHIIQNQGGLHGRLTAKLYLQPFSLLQTERFLEARGVRLGRQQIVELYMVLGGVAHYLKAVPSGRSPAQIVQELCFSPQGLLFREFYPLYRSLFNCAEQYVNIVKVLAGHRYGMSQSMLLEKAGLISGGSSTKMLQELEEVGVILCLPEQGMKKKGVSYRLLDEYSLFYLHWIQDAGKSILTGIDTQHWLLQQQSQRWKIWAGYTFENICFRHIQQVKQALGLAAVSTTESAWNSTAHRKTGASQPERRDAQIDLVIDRADKCINLCEMKFYAAPLVVDKKLMEELEYKRMLFREFTGTRKSLFTTLITAHGIAPSSSYLHVVDQQITIDELFS